MRNILAQLKGARREAWNHTGMLILAMQRVQGNKNAQFNNPYDDAEDPRVKFKQFMKGRKRHG